MNLAQKFNFSLTWRLLGILALVAVSIGAQDSASDDDENIEEMVVTGSRIVRTDLEGTSPVQIFEEEDIQRSGVTSLGQLLREMPSVAGGAQTTQVNYEGDGTNRISLRGLGASRTLVLMNGHRLPSSSTGLSSTDLESVVDLNTIPVSMVNRVEVFKDGASAIYGSDAVAGVVNIITRRDFQGLQLNVQTGVSQQGDGVRNGIDLTVGGSTDRGSFMAFAGYVDEQATCACDRDWARVPYAYFAGNVIFLGSSAPPWGRYQYTKDGEDFDQTLGPDYAGWRTFNFFGGDSYNFAPVNFQRQPSIRWSMSFVGDQYIEDLPILGDVRFSFAGSYLNRDGNQKLAETPLAPLAFFGYPAPYSKDNYYNPFGADIHDWRRRMVEDGSRTEQVLTETKQLKLGLDGTWGEWDWEAFHTFGETASEGHFGSIYNLEKVANAVGPSLKDANGNWVLDADGNPQCANDTANCVVLNTFGRNSVTPAMLDYITFVDNQSSLQDQKVYAVNVVNNQWLQNAAGPVGLAMGWEWREERGADTPDSQVNALGGGATGTPRKPTSGGYQVWELYGEIYLPLLAGAGFIEWLETNVAVRYSDFDTFGTTTNAKFGIKLRPSDQLTLRSSFSQAFRAPSTSNLFGGNGFSYPALVDPCSENPTEFCIADGVPTGGFEPISTQVRTTVGGNPTAQPETADSWTFGLVFEPNFYFTDGLAITVDYFNVSLTDALSTLGASFILGQCAAKGEFCHLIERFTSGPNAGNAINVINTVTNVGGVDTNGWDVGVYWDVGSTFFGDVSVRYEASLLGEYVVTQADGTKLDHTGRFIDDQHGYFTEYRSSTDFVLTEGNWVLGYQLRFIGEAKENYPDFATGATLERTVDSRLYHDFYGTLSLPKHNLIISGGIDNVLDEEPPLSLDGLNDNTDVRTFDTIGRYFYLKMSYSK